MGEDRDARRRPVRGEAGGEQSLAVRDRPFHQARVAGRRRRRPGNWDPVGTAVVPKHSDMPEWWVAAIGLVRLGRLLTEKDVRMMVYRVDERLRPHLDPQDLEEGEPVYHLGDWGYVRAKDYEAAFEGKPEWAHDMYMLDGNEPRDGHWANVYNRGGLKALGEELDQMFERTGRSTYTTRPRRRRPNPSHCRIPPTRPASPSEERTGTGSRSNGIQVQSPR